MAGGAEEFFGQLAEFSRRILDFLNVGTKQSPWVTGLFPENQPTGAILHYTGSRDAYSSAIWFCKQALNAHVSAHVIISPDWPPGVQERFGAGYPLVQQLPTMVIQCVPPEQIAHHATWVNDRSVGLELVNWGEIRWKPEIGWVVYPRDWTKRYYARNADYPQRMLGRFWEPYPGPQIRCAVEMLRWYRRWMAGRMQPEWVLGHEQVQGAATGGASGDKRDPGPLFPLHEVRAAAFSDDPVEQLGWFQKYTADPQYLTKVREGLVLDWYLSQPEAAGQPQCEGAQARFAAAVYELGAAKNWAQTFGALGKTCLRLLGYCIPHPTAAALDPSDVAAIKVFQRLVGITGDGKPGYVTRHEVWERMMDRGFL